MGRPLTALRLLRATPSLWPLVLLPALLTGVTLTLALLLAWAQGGDLVRAVLPAPSLDPGWLGTVLGVLRSAAFALLWLAVAGTLAFVGVLVASLLSSPVHDRLSAAVEARVLGPSTQPFVLGTFLADVAVGVGHSLLSIALWASLSCPLLVLSAVPVVGTVLHPVLSVGISSLLTANEALDYTWSRRRLTYAEKLGILWSQRAVTGGLGLSAVLVLLVPGLNLFVMPVAVIAATLLALELEAAGLTPPSRAAWHAPSGGGAGPQAPR